MKTPTQEELDHVVNTMTKVLHSCQYRPKKPTDVLIAEIIGSQIDMTSTPGIPWCKWGATNADLFRYDSKTGVCDPERVSMIVEQVKLKWEDLEQGKFKADPLNVFIKREPHKRSKLESKAYRLIMGVSVVDTIIDRLMFGDFLDKQIENYMELPTKVGMPLQGGNYKYLASTIQIPLMSDKSSFDFTVQSWLIDLDIRLMCALRITPGEDDYWDAMMSARLESLHDKVVIQCGLNGPRFVQIVRGIVKSGSLFTIGFNSNKTCGQHVLAMLRLYIWMSVMPYSVGDDALQNRTDIPGSIESYKQELERTGCIVKEIKTGKRCEFLGHEFDTETCVPVYNAKHAFQLLHMGIETLKLSIGSYQLLYAHHEAWLSALQSVALGLGDEFFLSRSSVRLAYDQPDVGPGLTLLERALIRP